MKRKIYHLQLEWYSRSKLLTVRTISPLQYFVQVQSWWEGYVGLDPHSGDVTVPLLPVKTPPQLAITGNQFGFKKWNISILKSIFLITYVHHIHTFVWVLTCRLVSSSYLFQAELMSINQFSEKKISIYLRNTTKMN